MRIPLICCVLFIATIVTSCAQAQEIALRVLSDVQLALSPLPLDVRWASFGEVYLSVGQQGVVRAPTSGASRRIAIEPAAKERFLIPSHIAVGTGYLAIAAPFGAFGLAGLEKDSPLRTAPGEYAAIVDIDARGDRVALLGAERGTEQGLAGDGAIAWLGSVSDDFPDMKAILKGRSQPGGKDVARCGFLRNGAIRFMADDSVVVFPGVESGVYRYDTGGKLVQTWMIDELGVLDHCAMDDQEVALLARDFEQRTIWMASQRTVDDILPMTEGPGLLLRHVVEGTTKWDLVILPFRGGKARSVSLPVEVDSPRGRIRGDILNDRIVLLAIDFPLPRQKPNIKPRMLVLSVER
jgi:hypothetical protein